MTKRGKNKTKERRNPPKMFILVSAKLIFLGEGGGYNMIYLHNIQVSYIVLLTIYAI